MPTRDIAKSTIPASGRRLADERAQATAESVSVADIVSAIEEDIVLNRVHPKERLVEEDLMQRFAGKRHVVRQALFQLENAGLVERIKNRGAFVKSYTPEEVEGIYVMRELLEEAAADRIPMPAPPALIDALTAIQSQHSTAVESGDLRAVFHHNIAFHRTLFAACGNDYLADTVNEFAQKAHAIRFIGTTDRQAILLARDEHLAMIDALKQQDRAELHRLCYQHLQPSKERYLHLYRLREGG
ncbi:GntR family transcriptional regulator [Salinicola halophyticus]|uniref:GntR family transcriptional regulator n=1 Tax=Salinicola halophyticus TaxID=1808881 RepID=UPI000DA23489|nr:GntR family transcriptional regulator [Salinicola halophyticus]